MNKIKIFIAYWSVVLLWSTTPLAIKWSAMGAGVIFSAMLRMAIGTVCLLLFLILKNNPLPWHKKALLTYLAISVQIFGAMMAVYWSALFIPSGWVSVIFGLTPFMTALFAAWVLGEKSLTFGKLLSYILSICGLALMFVSALDVSISAIQGIVGVLFASFLHSISAVWVKQINAKLKAIHQVTGGLIFALPVYLGCWFLLEEAYWPVEMPLHSLLAIIYLGIVATAFGFVLYYFVLTHQPATQVALLTIISPVLALWLGNYLNNEQITYKVVAGTGLILSALIFHLFIDRRQRTRK